MQFYIVNMTTQINGDDCTSLEAVYDNFEDAATYSDIRNSENNGGQYEVEGPFTMNQPL